MAFRLLFWRRPTRETVGRHVRATALAVPGSTGVLPAISQPDDNLSRPDVAAESVVGAPPPLALVAPVSEVPRHVHGAPQSAPAEPWRIGPGSAEVPPGADHQVLSTPDVAGVALGFADGASVELHPDDPRVTSFRAAAAALLDAPKA
jgi:hypothetical protein